ncbi:hypothetical protein ACPA9J_12855 [Pseudomonas aeruginosa]
MAYLDDAIDAFLADLEKQGVLARHPGGAHFRRIPRCRPSVRLASALGLQPGTGTGTGAALPPIKSGVYGHVDLAASVLDYFGYRAPAGISGRSLFRDYASGREMMSYTNGMLRHHDGKDHLRRMRFPAGLPALPQRGLHRRRSRVPRSLQRSPGTPGQPARRRPRPLRATGRPVGPGVPVSPPTNASA